MTKKATAYIGSEEDDRLHFLEWTHVLSRLLASAPQALEDSKLELADSFYSELVNKVQSADYRGEDDFMLKYLFPIGQYTRDESIWKYVTEAWRRALADDPDEK